MNKAAKNERRGRTQQCASFLDDKVSPHLTNLLSLVVNATLTLYDIASQGPKGSDDPRDPRGRVVTTTRWNPVLSSRSLRPPL